MSTQTESGKAFEYKLASKFSEYLSIPFIDSPEKQRGERAYTAHDEKERKKIERAADEVSVFIARCDSRSKNPIAVALQPDVSGREGDVRDILITTEKGDIGLSAKNRHDAIKHSRLSDEIDFGKQWAGYPCSNAYKKTIAPIFSDLRKKREEGMLFKAIPDKANRYYLPVLVAFEDEVRRLCEAFGQRFVKGMFQYLLGKYDFYKVTKENGHVAIQSFNINGDLEWGKQWKIPNRIDSITRKRGSQNTLIVSFTGGWQIAFRIHNASSRVEPSLKFDIKFIGVPPSVARHEIPLN